MVKWFCGKKKHTKKLRFFFFLVGVILFIWFAIIVWNNKGKLKFLSLFVMLTLSSHAGIIKHQVLTSPVGFRCGQNWNTIYLLSFRCGQNWNIGNTHYLFFLGVFGTRMPWPDMVFWFECAQIWSIVYIQYVLVSGVVRTGTPCPWPWDSLSSKSQRTGVWYRSVLCLPSQPSRFYQISFMLEESRKQWCEQTW